MKILFKNEGSYITYALDGAVLSFRDGELSLELDTLQKEYPIRITVFEDGDGKLTTDLSKRYVAELEIPGKKSIVEKTGVVNPFGFPVLRFVSEPLCTDDVIMTLWASK